MKTFFYSKYKYYPHPDYSNDWKDPLQTTSGVTGESKESQLFYSTNPLNLSWVTKNSGCGLFRIFCHRSVSLQRVFPEMGCPTLSKHKTFWYLFGLANKILCSSISCILGIFLLLPQPHLGSYCSDFFNEVISQ